MTKDYPGRGRVAVLRTSPETVLEDYARLLDLAGVREALPLDRETILKINVSWQTWYPACSTAPWQLEGVIRALRTVGYDDLIAAQNDTVVVDAYVGERNNKHKFVVDAYDVRNVHLFEPQYKWIRYEPPEPFLVLDDIYPEGVYIPELLVGRNIVQLPTVKTHVFTTITGAMKNAFGGLLGRRRHWTHAEIHRTLVDLLLIQQDVHPGLFAVMDGTFAGDGSGPRSMRWHEKDILLASSDQVGIDALSARLQGFDPLEIPFIRIAHDMGLGVGDPEQIEVVGEDRDWVMAQDWGFVQEDTFASRGQKAIYHGPLKPLEGLLLRSPLVPWSYFASNFYHNVYWYPFVGRERVQKALDTKWGKLFFEYGTKAGLRGAVMPGVEKKTVMTAAAGLSLLLAAFGAGIWLLARRRGGS
jgi:uncharacterized protein (DUF362 family)